MIIAKSSNVNEAHLMQTALAQHDIDAYLKDEYSVQTLPSMSNAIGGVKVIVRDEDAQKAEEILTMLGFQTFNPKEEVHGYESIIFNFTKDIPFIGKLSPLLQVMVFLSVIVTVLLLLLMTRV